MSVREIMAELPRLSDEEREMILRELVNLDEDFEPTPAMSDAIRQGLKLGLPKLREQLASPSPKPFTPEEAREAFAPDPEWDAVTAAMSGLPISRIEE